MSSTRVSYGHRPKPVPDGGERVWAPEYQLVDEVVAPLLRVLGKA